MQSSLSIFNFFFIYIIITTPQLSAHNDPIVELADKLLKQGYYYDSITEYKRYIFFNRRESELLAHVHFHKAHAYRYLNNPENAIENFEISFTITDIDSMKHEIEISLAIIHISNSNHLEADFLLTKVFENTDIPDLRLKSLFYIGINYLYSINWYEAHQIFNIYYLSKDASINTSDLNLAFTKAISTKFKSQRKARTISYFIPGGGQIYSGKIWSGINSFLLNAGTTYLLISSIIAGNYWSAFTFDITQFLHYYRGNIYRSDQAVTEVNRNMWRLHIQNIIKELDDLLYKQHIQWHMIDN